MAKPQTRQSYTYTGPVTAIDLPNGEQQLLYSGKTYRDLPEPDECPAIANLIARKVLIAGPAAIDTTIAPATAEGA